MLRKEEALIKEGELKNLSKYSELDMEYAKSEDRHLEVLAKRENLSLEDYKIKNNLLNHEEEMHKTIAKEDDKKTSSFSRKDRYDFKFSCESLKEKNKN